MRRRTFRRCGPVLSLAVVLASACGSASLPSAVVLGRYPSEPPALWERTVSALQTAGYEPIEADPARGTIAVVSRSRPARYGGARFELQLYREGWVRVEVAGWLVTRDGTQRVRVPVDVARELEELVFELTRIMGEPAEGAS